MDYVITLFLHQLVLLPGLALKWSVRAEKLKFGPETALPGTKMALFGT